LLHARGDGGERLGGIPLQRLQAACAEFLQAFVALVDLTRELVHPGPADALAVEPVAEFGDEAGVQVTPAALGSVVAVPRVERDFQPAGGSARAVTLVGLGLAVPPMGTGGAQRGGLAVGDVQQCAQALAGFVPDGPVAAFGAALALAVFPV